MKSAESQQEGKMKSVKVYLYVSAPPEQTEPQYVCVSHMKIR